MGGSVRERNDGQLHSSLLGALRTGGVPTPQKWNNRRKQDFRGRKYWYFLNLRRKWDMQVKTAAGWEINGEKEVIREVYASICRHRRECLGHRYDSQLLPQEPRVQWESTLRKQTITVQWERANTHTHPTPTAPRAQGSHFVRLERRRGEAQEGRNDLQAVFRNEEIAITWGEGVS